MGCIRFVCSAASHCLKCCRRRCPACRNLWLIATKDTALLAVVGFTELTLAARQAAGATKHYFLFLMAAGALYLIITLLSAQLFKLLENRVNRGARHA